MEVLKGAAGEAIRREPFPTFYRIRIDKKIAPEMARLTVARKIGALVLVLWKKGVMFDEKVMLKETAWTAGQVTLPTARGIVRVCPEWFVAAGRDGSNQASCHPGRRAEEHA